MPEQNVHTYYPQNFMGNPLCPLDDFFGGPVRAEKVDPIEIDTIPASLTELSDTTTTLLSNYMKTAVDGLRIAQVTHEMLPILWLLDQEGQIHLALEEVYEDAEGGKSFPLARGIKVPEGFSKLGHPSLISSDNKVARIAGELLYDPDPEYGIRGWVITNSSGRFGYGAHRIEKHLNNVADVFAAYGIMVDIYYIPPVSRMGI